MDNTFYIVALLMILAVIFKNLNNNKPQGI
jgi:hypothetical protein